jgi:hypothetical protein
MRCHPGSYRLSFLLPAGVKVEPGSHQPSPEGCVLHADGSIIVIAGPSREATFEHATRLLRVVCRGRPPLSIAAQLSTPARPSGRDTWSIIVGADVAFSPTSLDPHFPTTPDQERPPPALELVSGGHR